MGQCCVVEGKSNFIIYIKFLERLLDKKSQGLVPWERDDNLVGIFKNDHVFNILRFLS